MLCQGREALEGLTMLYPGLSLSRIFWAELLLEVGGVELLSIMPEQAVYLMLINCGAVCDLLYTVT